MWSTYENTELVIFSKQQVCQVWEVCVFYLYVICLYFEFLNTIDVSGFHKGTRGGEGEEKILQNELFSKCDK